LAEQAWKTAPIAMNLRSRHVAERADLAGAQSLPRMVFQVRFVVVF